MYVLYRLKYLRPVLAENLIRPIGTLFAVVRGSGILPVGKGMDWSAAG
jgi:hypothetical protein